MLGFLEARLPKEIIIEILIFEGRVLRAYLCDYVSQVYSRIYKAYFGYRHSLKYITSSKWRTPCFYSLPFYSAWSTVIRVKHPDFVKKRFPHANMRPYVGMVPDIRLRKERERMEGSLSRYFSARLKALNSS